MGGPGSGGKNPPNAKSKKNLMTFGKIDPEIQREWSSKGGKAAQAVLAKKRTFKQAAEWIMSMPAFDSTNATVEAIRAQFPDIDNTDAMTIAMVSKAINEGDVRAFTAIRDTTGELPEQTVNVSNQAPLEIKITTV